MKSLKIIYVYVPIVCALLLVLLLESQSLVSLHTADAENTPSVGENAPSSLKPKDGLNESPKPKNTLPIVQILVADWCPYCRKLEDFLNSNGIRYDRLDIERNVKAAMLYQQLGQGGVPIVKIGSDIIRGYDPGAILRALKKHKASASPIASAL
jgi:glutaredoxin